MEVWKIMFLSKWVICRFHANLPGCTIGESNWSNILKPGDFPVWKPQHFMFPCVFILGADDVLVFFGVPSNTLMGPYLAFGKKTSAQNCQYLRGELLFLGSQWRALRYSSTRLYLLTIIKEIHWKHLLEDMWGRSTPIGSAKWGHTVVPIKQNIKSVRTPVISKLGWVSDYPHHKFRIEPQTSPLFFFHHFCWVNLGSPNTVRRFLQSLGECQ